MFAIVFLGRTAWLVVSREVYHAHSYLEVLEAPPSLPRDPELEVLAPLLRTPPPHTVKTHLGVLRGAAFQEQALKLAGLEAGAPGTAPRLSADGEGDGRLIRLRGESGSPSAASRLANTAADLYRKRADREARAPFPAALRYVRAALRRAHAALAAVDRDIQRLRDERNAELRRRRGQPDPARERGRQLGALRLKRKRAETQNLIAQLKRRIALLEARQREATGAVRLVAKAPVPTRRAYVLPSGALGSTLTAALLFAVLAVSASALVEGLFTRHSPGPPR